ncbi:MAG: hypothetical protein L0Y72_23975 [Gemmataceae bacterium]|nr:hypothetical protein [Gemmataceae bacterium]MCI0742104.1 hypothetical protein [Gemmataceae bacterium]
MLQTEEKSDAVARLLRNAVAAAFLVVLGVISFWLMDKTQQTLLANQGLIIPPSALDLGEVWEDASHSISLPLQNPTDKDVNILGFYSSCSCVEVKPAKVSLPANAERQIQLTLDLRTGRKPNQIAHEFSAQLVPKIENAIPQQQGWKIHGRVKRALSLSPSVLVFGQELIAGEPFPPKKVRAIGHVLLSDLLPAQKSAWYSVSVTGPDPKRGDFDVAISPSESLPVGRFQFDIILRPIAADGVELPSVALGVEGRVLPFVECFPESVNFGAVPVGFGGFEKVLLRSRTQKDFTVLSFRTSSPEIKVQEVGDADGGRAFRIGIVQARKGAQSADVIFALRSEPEAKEVEVRLPVAWHGVEQDDGIKE